MITYSELFSLDNGPVRYAPSGRGHIKMSHKNVPLSILEPEFNYIHEEILKNNCQTGFEVATAFGISALAASSAFKKTGGKLLTMDAYIEENSEHPNAYRGANKQLYKDSMGYKSVSFLREHYELQNHLEIECGWSPDDITPVIHKHFGSDAKLDYVFIDSGHFSEQIRAEVDVLSKFVHRNTVVLIHDVYDYMFDPTTTMYVMETLKGSVEIVLRMPHGENMGRLVPFGEE
jgi:predicted O-methyltransferase YrrM